MIKGQFLFYGSDLSDVLRIREQVFLEEQKAEQSMVWNEDDQTAAHLIIYDGTKPVATGRLVKEEDGYKIGRIAVCKDERGKEYGDFVVRILLERAFQCQGDKVKVTAQLHAVPFYERYGFQKSGEEYCSEGLMCVDMSVKKENCNFGCQCH
ncbi:GNAT family N-acetyltransferase [Anaerolentibacter hominis]|uniref:GNAT family N-acetyltransferase n=1 Tax=Anaerolentibacter hominis TaxID=3079009 RepID=UPI0031B8098A